MAPHSSTLAWKIPWMEEPVGCSPWGREELDTTGRLHFHFPLSCIGEGNGNPLQCSCLENPRDGGAWWAAIYGVTQSQTRLKRLSSSRSSSIPHPLLEGYSGACQEYFELQWKTRWHPHFTEKDIEIQRGHIGFKCNCKVRIYPHCSVLVVLCIVICKQQKALLASREGN